VSAFRQFQGPFVGGRQPYAPRKQVVDSRTVQLTLVTSPSDITPRTGLTGLVWAWFDQSTPNNFAAPTDKGAAGSTDSVGLLVLNLPNTALAAGGVGWLIVSNSDGTVGQTPAELAFSGPVALN
jgi:hypothetical protein